MKSKWPFIQKYTILLHALQVKHWKNDLGEAGQEVFTVVLVELWKYCIHNKLITVKLTTHVISIANPRIYLSISTICTSFDSDTEVNLALSLVWLLIQTT